jgi:hypothetical protein
MESIAGFDFFSLTFDDDGVLRSATDLEHLAAHADAQSATDAILIAHGFRNDSQDATGVYTRFLTTLRAHLDSPAFLSVLGNRRFVIGGIYWPSKPFRETFGDSADGVRSLRGPETARAEVLEQLDDLKNDAHLGSAGTSIAPSPSCRSWRPTSRRRTSLVAASLVADDRGSTGG